MAIAACSIDTKVSCRLNTLCPTKDSALFLHGQLKQWPDVLGAMLGFHLRKCVQA